MPAISSHHPKTPLAASTNAVLLHQPLNSQLAHTNAALEQLASDARPAIGSAMFRTHRTDVRRHLIQMPARGDFPPPHLILMETRNAHSQHPALYTDRPDPPMAFDEGIHHFWPFAKYAVAFPRMSRSIVTRASSARKRTQKGSTRQSRQPCTRYWSRACPGNSRKHNAGKDPDAFRPNLRR